MLADQFLKAVAGARTTAALDETARLLWRAHREGHIGEAEANTLSEAIGERRAIISGEVHNKPQGTQTFVLKAPRASRRSSRKREKMFGAGRPRPLDRNAKARIMHLARCLSRRTEKGKAYGEVTAKALSVLRGASLALPQHQERAEAESAK